MNNRNRTNNERSQRRGRARLLGVGYDGDGHTRVTEGETVRLIGGSDSTHRMMQERAELFQREVDRLGYSLDNLTHAQYLELQRLATALAK